MSMKHRKIFIIIIKLIGLLLIACLSTSIYFLYVKEGISSLVGSLIAITGGITTLILILSPSTDEGISKTKSSSLD